MADSSRKWQITINNPVEHCFGHDEIKEALKALNPVYWCLCDEIGNETHTLHTHIYIYRNGPIRQSALKNKFPSAHLEICKGSSQENRDYIRKEGKYSKTDKAETNLTETFEEFGEMPIERQGSRGDLADLLDAVKEGKSTAEIIEDNPNLIFRVDEIGKARQIFKGEKYRTKFRDLTISYIWGDTETRKTSYIYETYGYDNVYRVTDYSHPFDDYDSEDVIVFEEFRSDLPCKNMLKYLEGYPLTLPARFYNRIACFTKVFIVSNIPLSEQYPNLQREEPSTFKAFLRRIKFVAHKQYDKPMNLIPFDFKQGFIPSNDIEVFNDIV